MSSGTLEEFRCSPRIGVRTPVVIYEFDQAGQVRRYRGWTDDLSMGGAKLITESRLASKQIYVRIMLPDMKDQLLNCEVVREDQSLSRDRMVDMRRCYYGVKFLGLADDQAFTAIGSADAQAMGRAG